MMVRRTRGKSRNKLSFVSVLPLCFLSETASCWISQQQQHLKTCCSGEGKQSLTRRHLVDRGSEVSESNNEEINFAASWKDFLLREKLASINNDQEGLPVDPRRGYYSLNELEYFAASRSNQSRTQPLLLYNQSFLEDEDEDGFLFVDDAEGGLNLDTDAYLEASINPDGSILSDTGTTGTTSNENDTGSIFAFREAMARQLSKPAPNSPSAENFSRNSYGSDDEAMQQLWQAMQQHKSLNQNSYQEAEEIHRQILEQEAGFQQQSALFKASLTNSTKAVEAAAYRHGERFRKQQAKALQKLEEQMKELEDSLMRQQNERSQQSYCGACGCLLSQDEIQHWQKVDDSRSSSRGSRPLCQVCYAQQFVVTVQQQQPRRRRYTTVKPSLSSRHRLGSSPCRSAAATATYSREDRWKEGTRRPIRHKQNESIPSFPEKRVEDRESTEPWQRVLDPDTGEVFYWNEETEEMRWDL